MHSSTSSSETRPLRSIVPLIAVCVALCFSVEIGTRTYFAHLSRMEQRRQTEYREALSIRSLKEHHARSALVVGNSLLLEGVDFNLLTEAVIPDVKPRRLVVENTSYLDWYYGLRGIFHRGARPDVVVLVLNPLQLTSNSFNGDYSARFLVATQDLPSFSRSVGANGNRASSLWLANVSAFYGARTEIRTWLMGKLLPGLNSLFRTAPRSYGGDVSTVASERFTQLRELCLRNGADLLVVLPPARRDSGVDGITQAAAQADVHVLIPIAPGVLPASDYADNFHLNATGAGIFTPALASSLKHALLPGIELAHEDEPAGALPTQSRLLPSQKNPEKQSRSDVD